MRAGKESEATSHEVDLLVGENLNGGASAYWAASQQCDVVK